MAETDTIPSFHELPFNDTLKMRHSWGVFGDDDQLGTINLLTPERVRAAATEIQRGQIFNLSLPLNLPSPSFSPRETYRHHVFDIDRNTQDDYLDGFYLQASSQWDGLRHVRAREFGFYNGVSGDDAGHGGTKLGIEQWAEHGIAGRGVLVDVASYLERQGHPLHPNAPFTITPALLEEVIHAQESPLRPGDILLLRTGYMRGLLAAQREGRAVVPEYRDCPGLAGDESMARFLWDAHIAAIVADNPAVEVLPVDPAAGYLHRRIIPLLGIALGELFNFEGLAEDCARDGRYTCFVVGVPLNLPGGVGSPANAIAIK